MNTEKISHFFKRIEKAGEGWVEKKLGDTDLLKIEDGDRGKNYPKKANFLSDGHSKSIFRCTDPIYRKQITEAC
jgi:hypothetical protein